MSGKLKPAGAAPSAKPLIAFLVGVCIMLLVANVGTFILMNQRLAETRQTAQQYLAQADDAASRTAAEPGGTTAGDAASGDLAPADVAALEEMLDPVPDAGLGEYAVINAHDHLYMAKHLDNYFPAAEDLGIAKTLFVASSRYTLLGSKGVATEGNEWNSREVLRVAREYPDKIIPYATFHPSAANKVELLEEYKAAGAHGLKLYSGHGNFYDRPLDTEEMLPVYEWCEREGFPICWHVNFSRPAYAEEFAHVLAMYPNIKIIVPHFGVTFYRPGGAQWQAFWALVDRYPGLYTDCSWGTRSILVHGLEVVSANVTMFRDTFLEYQDRILWGTDMVVTGNEEKTPDWIASVLRAGREMLEKETYYFWMAADGCEYAYDRHENPMGKLNGLALPPGVLEKIYETNYPAFEQQAL
ncbi:MAG: amidohydrolase family protein [Candidatus Hydrogenedentota bacterium]